MIQFANENTAQQVRSMWKVCFEDTDDFMNLYFSQKYKDENTLIYFENNVAVASLQMLPYTIRFYNKIIPFYYLSGLCTLPEYRNKGYMGKLIKEAFLTMKERNIPLSILIPAEEWLYNYYRKYNFEETFEESQDSIDLKPILDKYPDNISKAFTEFDNKYQQRDFTVLKSEHDFDAIIKDYIQDECPPKYNLRGMSAIVDPLKLLDIYAQNNPENYFRIKVHDELSDKQIIYSIEDGKAELSSDDNFQFDLEVSIHVLARLLFGFQTNQFSEKYSSLFEEHQPVLNLMLE